MPPKKSKDPAEPSSGGGAESPPSPAPEPEAVDPSGDTGVRPIGDAGLLRTVSEFRAAIGVEKPPPTPEKADAWRLGLEQLDLLQNLALELALPPAAVLGQTAAALVGILLGHEAASRPKPKSAAELAAEQTAAILAFWLNCARRSRSPRRVRLGRQSARLPTTPSLRGCKRSFPADPQT